MALPQFFVNPALSPYASTLASSLFSRYPFDAPSSAFSFDVFKSAYCVCVGGGERGARRGGGGRRGGGARNRRAPVCPPSPPRSVQSAVVHLMGVPPAARFALVPLGPPLLRYSATARTTLKWDPAAAAVVLEADRDLAPGDPVVAW